MKLIFRICGRWGRDGTGGRDELLDLLEGGGMAQGEGMSFRICGRRGRDGTGGRDGTEAGGAGQGMV